VLTSGHQSNLVATAAFILRYRIATAFRSASMAA
jgi:hypothetical protein